MWGLIKGIYSRFCELDDTRGAESKVLVVNAAKTRAGTVLMALVEDTTITHAGFASQVWAIAAAAAARAGGGGSSRAWTTPATASSRGGG